MRPEKIDDKFVSYATGQLQSASPLDKWVIEACKKVKEYNSISEEKRPNHSAVLTGTDNDDNYLVDCFSDEYGNGEEIWLEIIPKDSDDYKEMSYDEWAKSNSKLTIIVAVYEHVEMEIVDIQTDPFTAYLKTNAPKLLKYLKEQKLIKPSDAETHSEETITSKQLSKDREIYCCGRCGNYMELDAANTDKCPICGSHSLHFAKMKPGVRI